MSLQLSVTIDEIAKKSGADSFDVPFSWATEVFDRFLIWADDIGASDIVIKAGEPIFLRIHGSWLPLNEMPSKPEEISIIVNKIARSNSSSPTILGGVDMDFPHEVTVRRGLKKRFRCNATASSFKRESGISLTLRTIPSIPPSVEDLNIEQGLLDDAFIDKGLVLVTGVMGSGKSTLLAAILRHIIENEHKNIITYESPIEFDLTGIKDKKCLVQQTAVPDHLSGGFGQAVRNSARRAADIILVGESRDPETLKSMLEASEIGTGAYSTVHTRSVAETPSRIINVFPSHEQNQIATTLIASLRLIVQQRLLPKVGGGRVPLKEYLGFTQDIKQTLASTDTQSLNSVLEDIVKKEGHPLIKDLEDKYEKGLIYKEDYMMTKKELEH